MQRILLADDAELNRELLRDMLKEDYLIEEAQDGEEAIAKLQAAPEEIAALLLDLRMPKMDGFAVIHHMQENDWMKRIPVLIISGEHAAEIETRCLALGVADFIHKPFDSSIVQNRIKNAIEFFVCKNALEQTVKDQEKELQEQLRIIQKQTEKLKKAKSFSQLMFEYRAAIMEVETKLQVLNCEFSEEFKRNPFESIKSRLKSPESIYEKLERRGFPISVDSIRENLTDVAGLRVICSFPDDIYRLAELLLKQDDIFLLRKKDYIKDPKANGYRSLHLILHVPIFLASGKKYVKVEVQFRTIAMDFWASLEHKLRYKKHVNETEEIIRQLKSCADSIEELDYQMQTIRDEINRCSGQTQPLIETRRS